MPDEYGTGRVFRRNGVAAKRRRTDTRPHPYQRRTRPDEPSGNFQTATDRIDAQRAEDRRPRSARMRRYDGRNQLFRSHENAPFRRDQADREP
ncbi:hypothetical protein GHJ49_10300 [Alistipes sp. dk3620]|uniref:Uncharacterized protein n=1 Tax=Alistipes hominis TaxID=2763015 RepID=A0ABR7CPY6_9BACT|nr:hypothetical protein [Alistipes hominis]MBS1415093.1 hypothetical protein [Alistipes sp.]MBS5868422.1 hypothetical protein [Alistipes indistinctus]MQX28023.1 hypothetical protein [Alistipes sp. dk3620]QGA24675.1 hypothetical protein GFH31_02570 [Alistipes sp. dk3624]RHO70219.1 hypothetical protein DW082_09040 [Alistipes sp. AF48-12]RHR60682.1 hypothetical protein DWW79_12900 [Alistipes sp. AF17-16]